MSQKMGKVFAISTGSYSDYPVRAVCNDRETAEKWADYLRTGSGNPEEYNSHSDAQVEEIILIPFGVEPFSITIHHCSVELWDDGKESKVFYNSSTESAITHWQVPPSRPKVTKVRAPMHQDRGGRVDVWGPTEKGVRKALNDQVLMWRAQLDKRAYWG